jgi:tRNA pseudouridine55 synthase
MKNEKLDTSSPFLNRLFVAYKKKGVSSNFFLKDIKRKYKVKKAGYSGTLDPFAEGVLIVAFGQYTKLFNYLSKSPKTYRATLYLGAYSPTLDSEKIESVDDIKKFDKTQVIKVLQNLKGEIEYLPPKYSAKNINGKRAYELAREGVEFELKKIKSRIFDITLISYEHPYIDFEISISEGGYIRSIGSIIANRLGTVGALTALSRTREGNFYFDDEKSLNPLGFLKTEENFYMDDYNDILLGKKLDINFFKKKEEGLYHLTNDNFLTIIEIKNGEVHYKLNRIRMQGC